MGRQNESKWKFKMSTVWGLGHHMIPYQISSLTEVKHAFIISHRGSPELCWNMALLTGLSLMWFFFAESRSDYVVAKITRQDYIDRFTNDVSHCGNCSKYNASENSPGICTCNRLPCETQRKKIGGSVFIRSQGRCMSSCDLLQNSCFHWQNSLPLNPVPLIVIDVNKVNSTYKFIKNSWYISCEWKQHIEYRDARGHWESANVSAETFKVLRIRYRRHSWQTMIKVNKRSAVLARLVGHVMKLGLTCKRKDNTPIEKCLVFKSKGELNFTLCNYTATPSPSSTVGSQCTIVTPSIQTTTPTPTKTPEDPKEPLREDVDPIMVALLALLVVCLIIGAPVICFCFYTRGRNWNLHPREGGNFADNSVPQTYRIQEEPYYVELPDIEPANMRSPGKVYTGMATLIITTEEKQPAEDTVILNPYVRGASYTRARRSMPEPLPLRPIHEENAVMEEVAGDVTPNDEQNGHDMSVVLKNPQVRGTLDRSSPLSRHKHEHLPKERGEEEKDEVKPELGHHSRKTDDGNEHNLDYQRLVDGTRTQSLFICPCCDKDLDYQTLLDHCSLERKEQQSQKRESFYESLSPEKGKRESIYAIPLRSGESFSENEGTDNMEQWPEYQTLEPNETDSNREPIEPANHEYNELEGPEHNELVGPEHNELEGPEHNELKGPEQTCCEVDVDNKKLWQVHLGDSDSEIPREIIEILHVDINPAYALPWKKKAKEKSMRKRSLSV